MFAPHDASHFYRISSLNQSSTRMSEVTVLFYGTVREDWVLQQPISLKLERDADDSYVISEDDFGIYGHGATVAEAREDFIVALVEYFEILKQHANADSASRQVFEKFSQLWLPPA